MQVRASTGPISGAHVVVNGLSYQTGEQGTIRSAVPAGKVQIQITKQGFAPASTSLDIHDGQQQSIVIDLQAEPTVDEEVTVVASARTDSRLEDLPMRVEVLEREEIEEKMLMTPGDIVMMLNEIGGMRVQATSPVARRRERPRAGHAGRYTRFLSDGLPLFGEQVGRSGCCRFRRWISDRSRSSKEWRRRCTARGRWAVSST